MCILGMDGKWIMNNLSMEFDLIFEVISNSSEIGFSGNGHGITDVLGYGSSVGHGGDDDGYGYGSGNGDGNGDGRCQYNGFSFNKDEEGI